MQRNRLTDLQSAFVGGAGTHLGTGGRTVLGIAVKLEGYATVSCRRSLWYTQIARTYCCQYKSLRLRKVSQDQYAPHLRWRHSAEGVFKAPPNAASTNDKPCQLEVHEYNGKRSSNLVTTELVLLSHRQLIQYYASTNALAGGRDTKGKPACSDDVSAFKSSSCLFGH